VVSQNTARSIPGIISVTFIHSLSESSEKDEDNTGEDELEIFDKIPDQLRPE
jgi:hypothetical protein